MDKERGIVGRMGLNRVRYRINASYSGFELFIRPGKAPGGTQRLPGISRSTVRRGPEGTIRSILEARERIYLIPQPSEAIIMAATRRLTELHVRYGFLPPEELGRYSAIL